MRKRSTNQSTTSPDTDPPSRRPKLPRKSEPVHQDPVPQWLHDAATAFVASTPPLNWTGGFYSWGTWLDQLRKLSLWTLSTSSPHPPPWRSLIDHCRASGQVRGTAALYRAKSDLVSIIINAVYRRAEAQRLTNLGQHPAAERDIMRRVRAVVTRQRRHESVSLTLIRFLDLAFVFSAYKDCRLAMAHQNQRYQHHLSEQVESELLFFDAKPTADDLRANTLHMEGIMWQNRWLPWYEQVPSVRDEMVIRAREAALAFCDGLPFPELQVRAGVRGLSRDHLAGAGSMDEWLLTLFDPAFIPRWARLSHVYKTAVRDKNGEEDALLEETSRRVVERVLEPLTEVKDASDAMLSKLVDATPGIVVTQSVRIRGRFTFRQLLELHIHLVMFGQYLHTTFYGRSLPSIEEIYTGVVLFEEIRLRVLEVRSLIDVEKADMLFEWCLSITDAHPEKAHSCAVSYTSCVHYQRAAIKAAMGSAVMFFSQDSKTVLPKDCEVADSDPLTYAATIAQWDPPLAAKIIDAAVRIGKQMRERFRDGHGDGLDLYTHRRVLVCDAARDRFDGDVRSAARLMSRLHAVWEVCEGDKCLGSFDRRGAMSLKVAVDRGNFEAAAVFGVLLSSDEWEERRRACDFEKDVEAGIVYICKAVSMGDTAAAGDLMHLLQVSPGPKRQGGWEIPQRVADYVLDCLEVAAKEEPSLWLYLGYLYSMGAPGIPADCKAAIKAYRQVLHSHVTNAEYQGYAANNIGALNVLNCSIENQKVEEKTQTRECFKAAAAVGNKKAESNLAAVLLQEKDDGNGDLKMVTQIYGRCFKGPEGNSPVTVIQTNSSSNELNIFEMLVENERQDMFCRDLKAEGMEIEQYGKVLLQETVPCSLRNGNVSNGVKREVI